MVHVTLFAFGSWGDVRPLVVLGSGLKAAGYEVQVIASPGYGEWVRDRGLDFTPLSDEVRGLTTDVPFDVYKPFEGIRYVRKVLPAMLARMGADVLDATLTSDALITVEFSLALLIDCLRASDLRTIVVNPAPLTPTRAFASVLPPLPAWLPLRAAYNRMSYGIVRRITWWLMQNPRQELNRRSLGGKGASLRDYQTLLAHTPTLTVVSPHVLPRPDDWDANQHITGYLFDDDPAWTPPQDLTDFLAAGEPPVYIGFGSMPDRKSGATTRMLVEAVRKAGRRAVLLSGWAGLGAETLPDSVYLLKYAPHSWLFPQMAAVVHHGGAGTTASGFRAGVPTVVVPHNADQPYWGRVVKQLGVGPDPIPRGKLTATSLAATIVEATTHQEMKVRARNLGRAIAAEDGVGAAVRAIQGILGQQAPPQYPGRAVLTT